MRSITQITPSLPPAVNGVGDYAAALAQALQQSSQIDSAFLIGDQEWSGNFPAKVAVIRERTVAHVASLVDTTTVLLQYVGYGFDKRGCPTWLPAALAAAKKREPSLRIVTMFHELYAFGPPWRSSFWLSPVQRRIVKELLALSDGVAANCPLSTAVLSRWAPQLQIHTLATPSNVGEPSEIPALLSREPVMAIFGQATSRAEAWRALRKTPHLLACLGVKEIWDMGPGESHVHALAGVETKIFGQLQHEQIGSLLLRAKYGLISNPWRRLSRSGVLAAYTSHGLVPIIHTEEEDTCPTLEPTRHFLRGRLITKPTPHEQLIEVARAAHNWYLGHSIAAHARLFASLLT